jgi:hypothetical protein
MNPILILELIMLGMGLWILFKGKLPGMLYNDEKYHILAPDARLLGLTLLLPLPVSFVWLTSLTLLFGEGGEQAAICVEPALVMVILVIYYALQAAFTRTGPADTAEEVPVSAGAAPDTYRLIEDGVRRGILYTLLAAMGLTAPVLAPLGYHRADVAIKLIKKFKIGEEYLQLAKRVRLAANAVFLVYLALVVYFAAVLMTGGR